MPATLARLDGKTNSICFIKWLLWLLWSIAWGVRNVGMQKLSGLLIRDNLHLATNENFCRMAIIKMTKSFVFITIFKL